MVMADDDDGYNDRWFASSAILLACYLVNSLAVPRADRLQSVRR